MSTGTTYTTAASDASIATEAGTFNCYKYSIDNGGEEPAEHYYSLGVGLVMTIKRDMNYPGGTVYNKMELKGFMVE